MASSESVFKLAPIVALALLTLVLCAGCGPESSDAQTAPRGVQWATCGVNLQCGTGLECFGVCTFECGQKYFQQPDASYEYGLDVASVDRCAALGGTCEGYAPGVDINVCKLPSGVAASP